MNLKELQKLAVTMDTGQAKHPRAKVYASTMRMVLLIVLEK